MEVSEAGKEKVFYAFVVLKNNKLETMDVSQQLMLPVKSV